MGSGLVVNLLVSFNSGILIIFSGVNFIVEFMFV